MENYKVFNYNIEVIMIILRTFKDMEGPLQRWLQWSPDPLYHNASSIVFHYNYLIFDNLNNSGQGHICKSYWSFPLDGKGRGNFCFGSQFALDDGSQNFCSRFDCFVIYSCKSQRSFLRTLNLMKNSLLEMVDLSDGNLIRV